jgi:hypothetical protein
MNLATKQLTEALQELTERESRQQRDDVAQPSNFSTVIRTDKLKLANGVSQFLEARQAFFEKAKDKSPGKF